MAIARFEPVEVYTLSVTTNNYGTQNVAKTFKFRSNPVVLDVKNSLRITDKYRVYQDLVQFKFNYTRNVQDIVEHQQEYSFKYRGHDWRITDCFEANDRMSVTFMCYRSDPQTAV